VYFMRLALELLVQSLCIQVDTFGSNTAAGWAQYWCLMLAALPSALDDFATNPPSFRYNRSNSHYTSTQYRNAVVSRPKESDESLLTPRARDVAATQAEQAAARGLLTRYWDTPTSPPNLRDSVWRWTIGAKTGVTNMDDMGVVGDKSSGWGRVSELVL
jgi:hypothetical protein